MKTILIVEDDPKIALALQVRLKANGYAVSMITAQATNGVNETTDDSF